MTVMYELEQMGRGVVAAYLNVILLVHISSEANGDHFENAQSGLLSYLIRITSGTAGMLSGPSCSSWQS